MWTLLDSIGASLIGGAIIFMVLALIMQMNNISYQIDENNLIQSNYTTTMDIFNYDLHKIGYRVQSNKVIIADSVSLKYCTDLEDDGNVDTVYYTAISTSADSIGNDIYIHRKVNNGNNDNIGIVSDFNLSYYDSLGNTINYSTLISSAGRAKIRTIELSIELTVEEEDTTGYKDINWRVRVQPKNLLSRK